jgi:soluble lytic murein transglycosylase-like protein
MALAVAKVESNFKPNAVSPKGASGLFQLMPYPKGPAVSDAFDVVENSNAGNRYLARLYKKYGNWPDALAAYNWGPGNMDSDKPIPSKVQAYVDKVMSYSEDYA